MPVKPIAKMLHVHFPLELDGENIRDIDGIIVGSVFCDRCRIDRGVDRWRSFIRSYRQLKGDSPVFAQQPFYLMNGMEKGFLEVLRQLGEEGLLDGVLVNSAGMALEVSGLPLEKPLHQVFSRFGIHKRRRTNRYLLQQLKECGVRTLECFNTDSPLMEDIFAGVEGDRLLDVWIRDNANHFHSFSRACFVELYNGYCVDDPDSCASGRFSLANDKKNINLTTSGHFIYSGPVHEKTGVPAAYTAIVANIRENEL
jgi:hypothetical protein